MKRMMSITTLCAASLVPAMAGAEERNLNSSVRGEYAVTGEASCITTQVQGTPSGFFAPYPAYAFSQTVYGVRRFNGDGTGTIISGRSITITDGNNGSPGVPATGIGPVSVGTFTADFTYTVAPDHSIHIDIGPLTGIQTIGPGVGTWRDTEIWTGIKLDGHVSEDFKTILVATAEPDPIRPYLTLEYGTYPKAAGSEPKYQTRACHRSRVMVRISGGRGDDQFPASPFSRR